LWSADHSLRNAGLRYPDHIFGPERDEITDIGANGLMKVFTNLLYPKYC